MRNTIALIAGYAIAMSCAIKVPAVYHKITVPAEMPIRDSTLPMVLIDIAELNTPGNERKTKRNQQILDVKKEFMELLIQRTGNVLNIQVIQDTSLSIQEKTLLYNNDNNMIRQLALHHGAGIVAVLKNCYGGFEQDDVVVERAPDGSKTRTAQYSVFFESTWILNQGADTRHKVIREQKFHSTRNVMSGLLARGPGYAANKNDIMEMARSNADQFTGLFIDRVVNVNPAKPRYY